MFAIAFDLDTKALEKHYPPPKPWRKAYDDIENTLGTCGFRRIQGSVYVNEEGDMTHVFLAMQALRAIVWMPACVTDIRAFKVENWSNFTAIIKSGQT